MASDLMTDHYTLHPGDCITHMQSEMAQSSIDLMVTSVPFPALYAYTDSESDLGNSEGLDAETKIHFGYFFRALLGVMKSGRVAMVHCMQIPHMKRSGLQGLFDFRGFLIRLARRAGFIYEYDWLVRKNPQSQAIRTRSRSLQFAGLESDRAASRGSLCDYLIKLRTPGDNPIAVDSPGEVSRNDWIDWAEGAWDVRETNTLNVRGTKGDDDTKHICPLQLDVIDRLIRLYSNPGELVFDPFMGIGSTGYQAILRNRRAYGCELKPEYQEVAITNMERAIRQNGASQRDLFGGIE